MKFLIFLLLLNFVSSSDDIFKATDDWQDIKPDQKVPGGLHYRINLETGRKEAKLLSKEDDGGDKKDNSPILSDANVPEEVPEPMDDETVAKMRAKMKKMSFSRDVEQIKHLIAHYDNSTDDSKKLILDDLDYYLHQIDNANDFIFLGGFDKVVVPALDSGNADLIEAAAILLGSAAQSNPNVQNVARDTGLLSKVLELCDTWSGKNDILVGRFVFTLSSLVRGNEKSLTTLVELQGDKKLLKALERTEDSRLTMKILTFAADLLRPSEDMPAFNLDTDWCKTLLNKSMFEKEDLDHIEKFVDCLVQFKKVCKQDMASNEVLKFWLTKSGKTVKDSQESESDFERTVEGINELVTSLNFTKSEL